MSALVKLTDPEAEQRVITAMLHSDNACADAITSLEEKEFSDPFNLSVFSTISTLYMQNTKPTLAEVLKEGLKNKLVASVKDVDRLKEASSQYIDEANIEYWIQQVKTKARMRQMDDMLTRYHSKIKTAKDADAEQIINQASEEFAALSILTADESIQEPGEVAKLGYDLVSQKMERYRKEKDRNPYGAVILDGVPTGIQTLDELTLGFKPGDLIILGAQTGHGKTAFALNLTEAVAVKAQQPMLYVNTEMSKNQIALRWGAILSGINGDKIKNGAITNEELITIGEAYARLEQSKYYPVNITNLTPAKLQSVARKAKIRKDVKLIILDYVGRMETTDLRLQEWQVLYNIIKSQKMLAQNLEVAVVVLVQLNPDGSIQGAKKIKNECDLMLRLKPVPEDMVQDKASKGIVYKHWNYDIEVDKNRDGRSGNRIPISFDMETQRITQAVRIDQAPETTGWEDIIKSKK